MPIYGVQDELVNFSSRVHDYKALPDFDQLLQEETEEYRKLSLVALKNRDFLSERKIDGIDLPLPRL